MAEDTAGYDDGEGRAHPTAKPDRAVGIRLTVGALLFATLLLFTFVIATHQNEPVRPSASTEETGKNFEEVEMAKQDFEHDDAPGGAREPQQERERELQKALDAAREELEALKAAMKSAEQNDGTEKIGDQPMQQRLGTDKQPVERERAEQEKLRAELDRQRLEQEKSQAELEQQRRDQKQREAELEELLELEMAREDQPAQ